MVSRAITRIVDTSRIRAPGALDGVLRLELFNTAKEFFDVSEAWQERLPIYVEPYVRDYEIVSGEPGYVARLKLLQSLGPANVGGTAATYTAGGNFGSGFGGDFSNTASQLISTGNTGSGSGERHPIKREGDLVRPGADCALLRIRDLPVEQELWRAVFVLTVADPTDEDGIPYMPDWAVERYHEIFMHGMLSRLMMHPAKPYSNAALAGFHGKKFMQGMGDARMAVLQGSNSNGQRWRFPVDFRTRSQRMF